MHARTSHPSGSSGSGSPVRRSGRVVSGDEQPATSSEEYSLRPEKLREFVGQSRLCANLEIFIRAARGRREALDHVLLHGPPGLGKTTLARIAASELGVGLRITSGPVLTKSGDLAALLTAIQPRDVLFIDEIHRLPPAAEELLYPAMEDFRLDLILGEGPNARALQIDLPPFTLIGATTRSGLLTSPLRDRFGILLHLDFYLPPELQKILHGAARRLGFDLSADGAFEIARRSRGTPRIALRLLRRVRDFADSRYEGGVSHPVDHAAAVRALERLEVDALGLDALDRRYLRCIAEKHDGGPVGVETLSAALAEERDALEEAIEPFLLQQGLLQRSPRGRMLSLAGYRYLGLPPSTRHASGDQLTLLETTAPPSTSPPSSLSGAASPKPDARKIS